MELKYTLSNSKLSCINGCDYYWICGLNFITFLQLGEVSDPSLLAGDEKGKSRADGKVIVHSQELHMNDSRSACASSVGGGL